jgi:hypothetical protein
LATRNREDGIIFAEHVYESKWRSGGKVDPYSGLMQCAKTNVTPANLRLINGVTGGNHRAGTPEPLNFGWRLATLPAILFQDVP